MKYQFELDTINKEVIKKFINTNNSLLITGKSWTGKTELMKVLLEFTSKKHIILAPNNFEAVKSGSVSIKSFFKIPENVIDINFNFFEELKYSPEQINFIRELELIAIDEVTFLSSQMMDTLDIILKKIRNNFNPMGGIQLILVGDLCETLPFLTNVELEAINKHWKSEYFFDSNCYKSLTMDYFDLGGIYNKNLHYDLENLYFLIGNNNIESGYLDYLNRLFCYNEKEIGKLILTIDEKSADKINKENLENLSTEVYSFECDVIGEFDMNTAPVEPIIYLKKGSKVILTNALDFENEREGIFDGLGNDGIYILIGNKRLLVHKTEWINYEYVHDKNSNEYKKKQIGAFIQYPIRLGWAISIKNSKGMAFKSLHFDNKDVPLLGKSQAYSVYCRTLFKSNNSISIPFRRCDINANERVINFLFNDVYKHKQILVESDLD